METAKKRISACGIFFSCFVLLLCFGFTGKAKAQTTIAIDPALTGAVITGNSIEKRKMRDILENLGNLRT